MIFLQVSDARQMELGRKIVDRLLQQDGFSVARRIEQVRPVSQSDVRYFYSDDAEKARQVSALIAGFGIKAPPKPIGGFEEKVPRGQIEVWLGVDATPAMSK